MNRGDRGSTGTFEHKPLISFSLFLLPFYLSLSVSPVRLISLLREVVECLFLEIYKPDFTIFWTTCSM